MADPTNFNNPHNAHFPSIPGPAGGGAEKSAAISQPQGQYRGYYASPVAPGTQNKLDLLPPQLSFSPLSNYSICAYGAFRQIFNTPQVVAIVPPVIQLSTPLFSPYMSLGIPFLFTGYNQPCWHNPINLMTPLASITPFCSFLSNNPVQGWFHPGNTAINYPLINHQINNLRTPFFTKPSQLLTHYNQNTRAIPNHIPPFQKHPAPIAPGPDYKLTPKNAPQIQQQTIIPPYSQRPDQGGASGLTEFDPSDAIQRTNMPSEYPSPHQFINKPAIKKQQAPTSTHLPDKKRVKILNGEFLHTAHEGHFNLVCHKEDLFAFADEMQRKNIIVNAANAQLSHGGTFAAALVKKGGHGIQQESNQVIAARGKPLKDGEFEITSAHALGTQYKTDAIFHAVGPIMSHYKGANAKQKVKDILKNCYLDMILESSQSHPGSCIYTPLLSAGAFGVPPEWSAEALSDAVGKAKPLLQDKCPTVYAIFSEKYDDPNNILKTANHLNNLYSEKPFKNSETVPVIKGNANRQNKQWLAFFHGSGSINGHTRAKIKNAPHNYLEQQHDFIQAVFPNIKPGLANAPLLNPELVDILTSSSYSKELESYIQDMVTETMLPFWGIEQTGNDLKSCTFKIKDQNKAIVWAFSPNHNELRVTRMFEFLKAVGYGNYAQKLCKFMQQTRKTSGSTENPYWNNLFQTGQRPTRLSAPIPSSPQTHNASLAKRLSHKSAQASKSVYKNKPSKAPATLKVQKFPGGAGTAGYQISQSPSFDHQKHKIGTMIAANSGRPGGALGSFNGIAHPITSKDLQLKTQEETVLANWFLTTCGTDAQQQNKLFHNTIHKQWGFNNYSTSTMTRQGIDYKHSINSSDYSDAWVVNNGLMSACANGQLQPNTAFKTDFIFVAGPNANDKIGKKSGSMQRTVNLKSVNDYRHFRRCVKWTIREGLDAMAESGVTHAMLARISCGVYAGKHKATLNNEYQKIVNEVLNEKVGPNGELRRQYFDEVIIPDITTTTTASTPSTTVTKAPHSSRVSPGYQHYMKQYPYDLYKNKEHIGFYEKYDKYGNPTPFYEFTNFYQPAKPIMIDGHAWKTTEHYFQASKFPINSQQWKHIRSLPRPMDVFKYARSQTMRYSQNQWNALKDKVMLTALRAKAKQVPEFTNKLISTGNKPLFETSDKDSYWGTHKPLGSHHHGQNRLGAMLMQIRDEINNGAL